MSVALKNFGAFRADDLLKAGMPEKFSEIIEGELIVMSPAGWRHGFAGSEVYSLFREFCKTRPGLTRVGSETGFLIRRDPDTLLSPDASLFRKRPLPSGAWFEFSPEIAVEVLSPSNTRAEIVYKTREYFKAGSEQVWIADPLTRTLEICFRDGRKIVAQGDETLIGEGIAEGMVIRLAEIFRLP